MLANFSCVEFYLRLYQSSGKEKESLCAVFKSSTKHENKHFHVINYVVVVTAKKCTKKRDAHGKLLFCQYISKPIAFFAVLIDFAVVVHSLLCIQMALINEFIAEKLLVGMLFRHA